MRANARPRRLLIEFLLLFVVAPVGVALFAWRVPVWMLIPLVTAVCGVVLLRDPGFDRGRLYRWRMGRAERRGVLLRAVIVVPLLAGLTLVVIPERWLQFPRERPGVWAAVMVLYPVLSVYAQGVVYRAFVFHRYAALFGRGGGMVAASAFAFGFGHVVLLNPFAPVATLVGGWFFADVYRRTGSLPAACVEHALYGCAAFTFGIGWFFYSGSRLAGG